MFLSQFVRGLLLFSQIFGCIKVFFILLLTLVIDGTNNNWLYQLGYFSTNYNDAEDLINPSEIVCISVLQVLVTCVGWRILSYFWSMQNHKSVKDV